MLEFLPHFIEATKKALPILLVIFVVVFFLIIIARVVVAILLYQAQKNLRRIKSLKKMVYKKKKNFDKEEEELSRKKIEFPRAHSEIKAEMKLKGNQGKGGSYEIIESEDREMEKREMNEINIVDIVKPIGFWTSMILGQKLTYLISSAQIINKRGDQGFWASMIEAKERAAGKQHSRGR